MNFSQPAVPPAQLYSGDGIDGVETFPRWAASNFGVSTGPSGTAWFSFFTPSQAKTFSTIRTSSGDTAAAATPTVARVGLYTSDGTTLTLVARTANTTSLWAATFTAYNTALATAGGFPASYTVVPGQRYAWGLVVVSAAAMPTLYGVLPVHGDIMALAPMLSKSLAAQADLPTSQAISGLANNNRMFYAAGV